MRHMLLSIVGFVALLAPAIANGQAVKVATFKPGVVFQKMAETQELKVKMESDDKVRKAAAAERTAKLQKLNEELQQLKRDSAGFAEKNRELRTAQIEAQTWDKVTVADMEAKENAQSLALFKKIQSAISEVSKSKGIDLVLADVSPDMPESVEGVNKQQFTQFIKEKSVWYTAGAVDTTNDVLAKVDADYKAAAPK